MTDTTREPPRWKLPDRRPMVVHEVDVDGTTFRIGVGLQPKTFEPREVFIVGPKPGSPLALICEDAAVLISVALQHGLTPASLQKSLASLPRQPLSPPYLDQPGDAPEKRPATVIGVALDIIQVMHKGSVKDAP